MSDCQYILAENYHCAVDYAERNKILFWTYVKDVNTIHGISAGTPIICYGHWDLRLDYMALRRAISERRLIIVVGKRN